MNVEVWMPMDNLSIVDPYVLADFVNIKALVDTRAELIYVHPEISRPENWVEEIDGRPQVVQAIPGRIPRIFKLIQVTESGVIQETHRLPEIWNNKVPFDLFKIFIDSDCSVRPVDESEYREIYEFPIFARGERNYSSMKIEFPLGVLIESEDFNPDSKVRKIRAAVPYKHHLVI